MASNSSKGVMMNLNDESDDGVGVYIRHSKKKIMTSRIVSYDELTNLIQERLANQPTVKRSEYGNQLAKKLYKKFHENDHKNQKMKGNNKRRDIEDETSGNFKKEIIKEDSESNLKNTPHPLLIVQKKSIEETHLTSSMTSKEIVMTILNCKKILEDKKSTINRKDAAKLISALKLRLANKLKTN